MIGIKRIFLDFARDTVYQSGCRDRDSIVGGIFSIEFALGRHYTQSDKPCGNRRAIFLLGKHFTDTVAVMNAFNRLSKQRRG